MPPVKTQIACPNCRVPMTATLEQLFDVTQDPSAKRRFLSGNFNALNCPNCGFHGQASTPLLYHDADKELLLSFVPMELALPQPEQEKLIGRLMNDVINRLPQEKRKGYLLNPKPAFTLQGMLERVLEAEGIDKEKLEAQRAKVRLIEQFLTAPDERLPDLVQEHDAQLNAEFFQVLAASAEAQAAGGSPAGAQRLADLQQRLIDLSSYGAQIKQRQKSFEGVVRELQNLGDKLTQDKLLELILKAQGDDDKIAAYVSLVRPGLDYVFFEALTKRIDKAQGEEQTRLTALRDKLLRLTEEIDRAAQAQMEDASQLLRSLLEAPDLGQALLDSLPQIDDTFMAVLNMNIEAAQKAKRPDLVQRLETISEGIMRLLQDAAPPEIRFINELLQMESDEAAVSALKGRSGEINQGLVDAMNYIVESLRQNKQMQLADRLEMLRGVAVGELMAANWNN